MSRYDNRTRSNRYSDLLTFIIFFFNYLGFYAFILIIGEIIGLESSRVFTIPIRFVILLSILLLFVKNIRNLNTNKISILFGLFTLAFLLRLFLDTVNSTYYYISTREVLFYFLSFCVIPFTLLSRVSYTESSFNTIFNAFLYSGVLFSIFVLVFYGQYIGKVSRLGQGTTESAVINPLALSYSSVLVISVFSFYLIHNKANMFKKIIALIAIILSVVPFFLGASRGSLLALATSVLVYFISDRNYKKIIPRVLITLAIIGLIIHLDNTLSSGLIERLMSTYGDSSGEAKGNERLSIWQSAFAQFVDHPFWGDKLAVNGWENYAHNIFVEALQTTGMLGFLPLLGLFIYLWHKAFIISKHHREYFWIVVIFIQTFIQNLFSGALYISSWLWFSAALILGLNNYLKAKKS